MEITVSNGSGSEATQTIAAAARPAESASLQENEFLPSQVPPGAVLLVGNVAVFNVDGALCATQLTCPHRQGPLNEGTFDGSTVTCPWHGSQFDVRTGAVLRGPATDPLMTYRVTVDGEIARIEVNGLTAR